MTKPLHVPASASASALGWSDSLIVVVPERALVRSEVTIVSLTSDIIATPRFARSRPLASS